MIAIAAFLLVVSLLVNSEKRFLSTSVSAFEEEEDSLAASMLALVADFHSADGRLVLGDNVSLGNCSFTGEGVACGNGAAKTRMRNSGRESYAYYSLPS